MRQLGLGRGSACVLLLMAAVSARAERLDLRDGWALQSAARVAAAGETVSRPGFATTGWQRVRVPNTVVGALVEAKVYPDPYFGMNLRQIPGTSYPIGGRFTLLPTPDASPFKAAWWYRNEFTVPASLSGQSFSLRFDGINYRANVWLNGTRLADARQVAGAFRRYRFDVTGLVKTGAPNVVAVQVTGPEPQDLAFMWVDWNPTPADKNMGLWGAVALEHTGPLAIRFPHVMPKLALPSLAEARLTVTAEVTNTSAVAVSGVVRGTIESAQFSKPVSLAPGEKTIVRFTPDAFPQLVLAGPRVWWPYRMGQPELYTLALDAEVAGSPSDHQQLSFGIQQVSSELTAEGHRLFKVNGKPLLIRGGGWASDMLLREASRERLLAELRYVREMGLNTIRLEGKPETDEFYELADRYGILVMPGWCCCDQWEMWDKWDAEDHRVGPASLRDQILRLRNHPSVFVWLNGSDNPPPADVERAYLNVLEELEWQKPVVSNATGQPGPLSGPSGMKMLGPYDYVPPSYWLTDKKNGGAFGFATEIGPGAAVPEIESLKRMLPADRLWPINEQWTFHAGGDEFKDLHLFTGALEARLGAATSAEDYARKAQLLAYDGERAMFEAYARNKYGSTGVIQWMLNNAWPSMIWHLYDYYLRPGGGYYGTKKACEPLHVQFSYDDRSVVVVNDRQQAASGLAVSAEVLDLDLASRFSQRARLDVPADGVARAFAVPPPQGLRGKTYLLRLSLADAAGSIVSRNSYWLSTQDDVLDWPKTQWYYTPTKTHGDLQSLAALPQTALALDTRLEERGAEGAATIAVRNEGKTLAVQVRLKIVDRASGEEILPVYFDDNYFELVPGETRTVRVAFPLGQPVAHFAVLADAWNAAAVRR